MSGSLPQSLTRKMISTSHACGGTSSPPIHWCAIGCIGGARQKKKALRFQIPPTSRLRKLSEFINFERVGTADDFPSDAVRLRNISHCLSQVGKPALTKTYFIDGWASPTRPYYRQGLLPCLTASRAQSGGHFIAGKLMRMTDVDEMVRFMNLHPYLSANLPDSEQLSARQFGHAIGNSIDALLLSKILGAALGMVDL